MQWVADELTLMVVLVHLLVAPVYLVLGTIKHELAHALMGWAHGYHVEAIYVFPRIVNGHFVWGYTAWEKPDPGLEMPRVWEIMIYGAPYFVDLILIGLGFVFVPRFTCHEHVWTFMVMLHWVLPVVDIAWASFKKLTGRWGDFDTLFK